MQRVDIVIIALVAVAVVGSAIGLAWYDSDGVSRYEIQITQHDGSGEPWDSTLTGPQGSDRESWNIGTQNLTEITFNLAISSTLTPRTQATEVTFVISPPDGNPIERTLTIPADADSGSDDDTVEIHIEDVPELSGDERRVLGTSEENALLDDEGRPRVPTTTNGTGEWTINADVTAGGATFLAGQNLGNEDIQVDVTLDYRFYMASADLQLPDISPAG